VEIFLGKKDKLFLGNMDSYRDWGHSKDYTRAMIDIINHDIPDDFVVATGETHSVRELCEVVFEYLQMDYRDYIEQDPKFLRPQELKYLKGDPAKTKNTFGWEPEYTFESMMIEMVEHWLSFYGEEKCTKHM
jgi:GDPmannose 4,6-dehydratase